MNSITITLDETDLMALQEVLLDEDPGAALAFVRENICPKIPSKGTSPCDSTRLNPYLFERKGTGEA